MANKGVYKDRRPQIVLENYGRISADHDHVIQNRPSNIMGTAILVQIWGIIAATV